MNHRKLAEKIRWCFRCQSPRWAPQAAACARRAFTDGLTRSVKTAGQQLRQRRAWPRKTVEMLKQALTHYFFPKTTSTLFVDSTGPEFSSSAAPWCVLMTKTVVTEFCFHRSYLDVGKPVLNNCQRQLSRVNCPLNVLTILSHNFE